jgi:NTE family protein
MEKAETPAQRIARELAEGKREPKIGLALSGGGFRAALFHIGVLARLAEAGLLRKVRVISTVSGGAIVGALYYLHVLRLLESKADTEITDRDYREIVQEIARDFPAAVARNVRGRAVANPFKNVAMALVSTYSRTYRIAELYEQFFYAGIWESARGPAPLGARRFFTPKLRIAMTDLMIHPKGWPEDERFDPDEDNEGRGAPVPILLINAASLNTGHNWRFEAVYMGEPDLGNPAVDEADKNTRLARTPYTKLPEPLDQFRLGAAVAAAAAFPVLCRPVDIRDLFEDSEGNPITVTLMDGGAHDNQGIEGLLDRDCTHLIVSDGAGQMGDENNPGHYIPKMVERASGMMFDHARELQVIEAFSTLPTAFMHLMKGLEAEVLRPKTDDRPPPAPKQPKLPTSAFDVAEESQRLIAEIRTDLDSFSETEARSLMLDGYLMTEAELDQTPAIQAFGTPLPPASDPWLFESIGRWLQNPTKSYRVQLKAASGQLLKPFKQSRLIAAIVIAAGVLALAAVIVALWLLLQADFAWSPFWTVLALVTVALTLFFYLKPVPIVSSALFDRVFPGILAPFLPVVAFVFLLEGWIHGWLGKQSRL